jgi:hypothetical protein
MLFHLTDFSALVPAQDCDITSFGLEMMEEKIDVALDCNADTKSNIYFTCIVSLYRNDSTHRKIDR